LELVDMAGNIAKYVLKNVFPIILRYTCLTQPIQNQSSIQLSQSLPALLIVGLDSGQQAWGSGADRGANRICHEKRILLARVQKNC